MQRQRALLALREHGGAFPLLIEAAPVHAYHDAERLLEAAVGHGLFAIEADAVRPGAREAVHVPHAGAELRADAMAIAGVERGARCVHAFERQIVLQHLGVVLETAAGHDHALARTRVHALALVLVHAAEHGLRLGILHERGQGCVRLARHLLGVLLKHRVQEFADMLAVLIGVVAFELAFGKRIGVLQFEPLGFAVALRRDLDVVLGHAQAGEPFPILGCALRVRLVDGGGRGRHAAEHRLHVHGEGVRILGDVERPAAHRRVAAADGRRPFFQQKRGVVAAFGGHRDGCGEPCGARAHHDDVVLLVPGDVGDGGRGVVRGGFGPHPANPSAAAPNATTPLVLMKLRRETMSFCSMSPPVVRFPSRESRARCDAALPIQATTARAGKMRPGRE